MPYEKLLKKYDKDVRVKEKPLKYGFKGLYKSGKVIWNKNLKHVRGHMKD